MGKVLQAVVNRKYSYDAIVPKWSSSWGNKPEYYDHMRNDMNNFNIGASLYVYQHDQDPNDENTTLNLLGTALNIKGQIKAGHAETRLLLTLDALNVYMDDRVWYTDVTNFFQFNEQVNIVRITQFYEGKHVALLSSLKPCYLCVGETEASSEGFIKTINNAPVNMWASFPYIPSNPVVKEVLYFDIDEPIDYASSIFVTWNGEVPFNWHLTLAPWNEWTALWHQQRDSLTALSYPSGPRVIAPAGECLKTGYSYLRYLNSAKLLCTPQREYLAKMTQWTTGNVQDTEL